MIRSRSQMMQPCAARLVSRPMGLPRSVGSLWATLGPRALGRSDRHRSFSFPFSFSFVSTDAALSIFSLSLSLPLSLFFFFLFLFLFLFLFIRLYFHRNLVTQFVSSRLVSFLRQRDEPPEADGSARLGSARSRLRHNRQYYRNGIECECECECSLKYLTSLSQSLRFEWNALVPRSVR